MFFLLRLIWAGTNAQINIKFIAIDFLQAKKSPNKVEAFLLIDPGDVLLSHGNSHTTIGDATFHFWVRDGFRWCYSSIVTRKLVAQNRLICFKTNIWEYESSITWLLLWCLDFVVILKNRFSLREIINHLNLDITSKPLGCYMIKPHGQLVLVSFIHYCTSTPSLSTL